MPRSGLLRFAFLLLSIYMLVLSPLIAAFKEGADHLHLKSSGHVEQLSSACVHHSTWSLFSNHQLTAPPVKLTIKDLAVIFCCAGFLLFIDGLKRQLIKCWLLKYQIAPLYDHLYLLIRSLLI
jgi:hypothetical protein